MRLIDADKIIFREIDEIGGEYEPYLGCSKSQIDSLPSITPQEQRKGHWIDKSHLFESCSAECSVCGERSNGYVTDNGFSLQYKYYDFCPKCGAKMEEVEE